MDEIIYDLYLWPKITENKLYKIPKLSHEEAVGLSKKWMKSHRWSDFILVTQGSTPWMIEPQIIITDPSFIDNYKDGDD